MITQIRVENIGQLAEAAVQLTAHFRTIDIWYRGHACSSYKLLPTLIRKGYPPDVEAALYERFRIRAASRYPDFPIAGDPQAVAHRFTLMRHYGLPSRLLDWSASVLVAAFFAVGEVNHTCDAVIWALCPQALNETRKGVRAILNLSGDDGFVELRNTVLGRGSTAVFAASSPELDPRMFVQQGSYTFHGDPKELEAAPSAEKFLVRLVIPAALRTDFACSVMAMGMRLSTVYPDLTNLARDIEAEVGPNKILFDRTRTSPCGCS